MTNNYVDATGLNLQDLNSLVAQFTTGMQLIYGSDINVGSNTSDGQLINLFAQAQADILDCIASVYNSFSPSNAVGVVLDQRCALNGVIRQGASYTRTNITIVTDRSLTLQGVDTTPASPFTVSDSAGNKILLEVTTTIQSGTSILEFQAQNSGPVETTINTITIISTITLGVLSCNNPTSAITIGVAEETDAQLRLRRGVSAALSSTGYLACLIGGLKNVLNVIDATAYENFSGITDTDGIPSHSIWCVVDGGTSLDIATVIYKTRNAGCGMRGSVIQNVLQPNGYDIAIKFDRPVYTNLYIQLVIASLDPAHTVNVAGVKTMLFNSIVYKIYQPADYTEITTFVKEYDPLAVITAGGVSITAGSYVPFLYPATKAGRFLLDVTRMDITTI